MKKILLASILGMSALSGNAEQLQTDSLKQIYTDDLVVTINDVSTPAQKASIEFEEFSDGTCNLLLRNFALTMGEETMYVGNIDIKGIETVEDSIAGYRTFETSQTIYIKSGDDSSQVWIGPLLGEVPIRMKGKYTESNLYCTIDITMVSLNQEIQVVFGQDITSGISSIQVVNKPLVDVYNLQGVLLRQGVSQATALDGLPKGIYIVNGKKIIKK